MKAAGFKEAVKQIEEFMVNPDKFAHFFDQDKGDEPDVNAEFDKLRSANDSSDKNNDTSSANISSTSNSNTPAATPKKATPGRKQKLEPKTTTPAAAKTTPAAKAATPAAAARTNASAVKRAAAASSLDNSAVDSPPTSATKAKRPRVSSTPKNNHQNNVGGAGDTKELSVADSNSSSAYTPTAVSRRGVQNALLNRPSPLPPPDQPEIDMSVISETLQSKNIQASSLRFGFLGLGLMGSGIVKNLINSGHKVVVWNRTEPKCRAFKEAGAEVGDTPSDVVDMTDIIFSCVADPQAAKDVSRNFEGLILFITGWLMGFLRVFLMSD